MHPFSPLTLPAPIQQQRCDTDAPAHWIVSQYLLSEFQFALLHEPGIVQDKDTEYLHQYRVSLRKCRSLLAILAPLYQPQTVTKLKKQLQVIMEPSGLVRDLDVFLAPQSHPESLRETLTPLLPVIAAKRARVFHRFSDWLQSDEYQHLKQQIFTNMIDCAQHPAKPGLSSITSIGTYYLGKQNKKLFKTSHRLHSNSPDKEIHKLRICCKKLRYLSTFCLALGIAPATPSLTPGQLKRLQTELGEFNDTSCQLEFCHAHLAPLKQQPESARAIATFIAHAHHQHQVSKQRLLRNLNRLVPRGGIECHAR